MKMEDVRDFFDKCAPTWDAEMILDEGVIGKILDNARVGPGCDVLDVACGTGVLIPYYLMRGAASIDAIDLSPEMIRIAKEKIDEKKVTFFCGDVEQLRPAKKYDCIVVYNAFPHFPEPSRLIYTLSGMLKENGTLTVAHGMSRERINAHHRGRACNVSRGLMESDELAKLFAHTLRVTVNISDGQMYQVAGSAHAF